MPKPRKPQSPSPPAAPPRPQLSEDVRRLAAEAMRKRTAGQVPTVRERKAFETWEAHKEEQAFLAFARRVPKRIYKEMSGRQDKVINDQAERHRMPLVGPTVDLFMLATWLHNFLADNSLRLRTPLGEDALMFDEGSDPWLTEYRKQSALKVRLEREEKERKLLPRDKCHESLANFSTALRRFGEWLEKKYGRDALEMFNATLEDASRELRYFDEQAPDK